MPENLKDLISNLSLPQTLARQRAQQSLKKHLTNSTLTTQQHQEIEQYLSDVLQQKDQWQKKYGALIGAEIYFKYLKQNPISEQKQKATQKLLLKDNKFISKLISKCISFITDRQFRVRQRIGQTLQSFSEIARNISILQQIKPHLVNNIKESILSAKESSAQLPNTLNKRYPSSAKAELLSDTDWWTSLDTSVSSLSTLLKMPSSASADVYAQFIKSVQDDDLIKLIEELTCHVNRFVREVTYKLISSIFILFHKSNQQTQKSVEEFIKSKLETTTTLHKLIVLVSKGLSDNWSQVRMSASKAVREFYKILISNFPQNQLSQNPLLTTINHLVLPKICLNRYYVASGVRIHSIETWRLVLGSKGKQFILNNISPFIEYYTKCTEAQNHAVRQASCHCISQLCAQVIPLDFASFTNNNSVDTLLKALIDCFKDQSWPVRDSACIACSQFVKTFPVESKQCLEDELLELWRHHLSDNIRSVREHSAIALSQVVEACERIDENEQDGFGARIKTQVFGFIDEMLGSYKKQGEKSQKFSAIDVEKGTKFGVPIMKNQEMKEHHHHHHPHEADQDHENEQMFSCGSLGPKLRRGGGCMDHGFIRAKEPWEETEGAVFLIRELSDRYFLKITKYLQTFELLCNIDTFKNAKDLRESVYKSLSKIVRILGKDKKLKKNERMTFSQMYLQNFIQPTFRTIRENTKVVAFAAMEFIQSLQNTFGFVLKALIEQQFPDYMKQFCEVLVVMKHSAPLDNPNQFQGPTSKPFHENPEGYSTIPNPSPNSAFYY